MPKSTKVTRSLALALAFAVILVMLPIVGAMPAYSQGNTCAAFVDQAARAVVLGAAETGPDQAFLGHPGLSAAMQRSANGAGLKKPGDRVAVGDLQSLSSNAANVDAKTWGVTLIKLKAGLPDDGAATASLILLGDSKLTNLVDPAAKLPTATLTNRNKSAVNVYAGPGPGRALVGTLNPFEKVTANGRTEKNDWLRFERNGLLAWVPNSNIALSQEIGDLTVADEKDITPLFREPMQTASFESASSSPCKDAPNGLLIAAPVGNIAHFLIDGAQIGVSGGGFLTASNDELSVFALQGRVTVTADGQTVFILPGQVIKIPIKESQVSGPLSAPSQADNVNYVDLLNSMIYGQRYAGAGSTAADAAISLGTVQAAKDEPLRIDVSFTGDGATCKLEPSKLLDAVVIVDASDALTGVTLDAVKAGIARFAGGLQPDDQLGVVAYGSSAQMISPLGAALDMDAVSKLTTLQPGTVTSAQVGLAAGLTELKRSARGDKANKAVILVTTGGGDADAVKKAAAELKDSDVRLITIGLGHEADNALLASLTDDAADSFTASGAPSIGEMLDRARLALTQPIAARDISMIYTLDSSKFALDDALAKLTGGNRLDNDTVEWRFPIIRNAQTVRVPLVVKPIGSGAGNPGAAKWFYSTCADAGQKVTTELIPAPSITVGNSSSTAQPVNSQVGVLKLGETGTGTISAFGVSDWLLNLNGEQTFSILTEGSAQPLSASLDGASLEPLYTLDNVGGDGNLLSVFYVPSGGSYLLHLYSRNAAAAGAYKVSFKGGLTADPTAILKVDGDRLQIARDAKSNGLYSIDGAPTDKTVTISLRPEEPVADASVLPLRIVSVDGKTADALYTRFDAPNNQWLTVQKLNGNAPYFTVVKQDSGYELAVESEDTLTNDRGTIKPGETRKQIAKNGNADVTKYQLEIPDGKRFSLVSTGPVKSLRVADSANRVIPFASSLNVNNFRVNLVDLAPGTYTVYVESTGDYEFSVAAGEVFSTLKGSLGLAQTKQETLPIGQKFAAYRLAIGTSKALGEGDPLTLFLSGANVGKESVYIESADGLRSEVVQDFLDLRADTPQLTSVQALKGAAPYRVRVTGPSQYTIRIDEGDLLNNDKGALVLGQTVRDSSRSPEILYYTLVPELGKQLTEGDQVTVGFTPQSVPPLDGQKEFESAAVTLQNGTKQTINPLKVYAATRGRQLFSVYELQGDPPYRLGIPNVGGYTLSLTSGNTLELDQGKLDFGKPQQARTSGPQIVKYSFDADPNQVVTLKVADTRKQRSDFAVVLANANGEQILPRRGITETGAVTNVYVAHGPGPYRFQFEMDGIYEATLKKGDDLTLYKGNFFIGDAESGKVDDRSQLVTYNLTAKPGQVISIEVSDYPEFTLRDPDDKIVQPDLQLAPLRQPGGYSRIQVYDLKKPGVYELSFARVGPYTLRVTEGNKLITNKGNFYLGNSENDKLPTNIAYAQYTITADEGSQITLNAEFSGANGGFFAAPENPLQLRNAAGELQQVNDQLNGTGALQQLVTLQGAGPYTLLFKPDDNLYKYTPSAYKLTVGAGNQLSQDKGTLSLDTPVDGDTGGKDVVRKVIYSIDGKAGQSVTFSIDKKQAGPYINGTLKAPSGQIIEPNGAVTDKNASISSYSLPTDGVYQFSFVTKDTYTLTAKGSDVIRVNGGSLTPDAPVTNTLKGPAQIVSYTIDGKEGDQISLQLKQGNNILYADLRDANGDFVFTEDQFFDRGVGLYLYKLSGPGPYQLIFAPGSTPYTVTLSGKDVLNAQMGTIPPNPATSADPKFKPTVFAGKLPPPARVAYHTIDGKAGDLITLQLNPRGGTAPLKPRLVNKEGLEIGPLVNLTDRAKSNLVYKLEGSGPYTFVFETPSDYEITLTTGDVLHADKGVLPTGIQEKPYQNKLDAPALIAVHQLDAVPGQVVTVQLQNAGKKITSTLTDGNGEAIKPEVTDFQNGNNVGVYILSGIGPYALEFPATGQYTASVLSGNLIRLDQGVIAFAQPITGTLPAPARVGTYTVDGKRDQIVTVQLQADGNAGGVEFRDSNGKLWSPDFQFVKSNQQYLVYLLAGPPPYTLTFGGQRYTVSVNDGNVVRAELGAAPLGQKVSSKLDAPAQVAVYSVEGNPGELLSVQLSSGGKAIDSELRDADGKILKRDTAVVKGNLNVSVYTLSGKGPYKLEFSPTNQYDLTVSKGNALRVEQGKPELGKQLATTLPTPGQTAIYDIDGKPGDVLSIELQVSNKAGKPHLLDAGGNELSPAVHSEKANTTHNVYTLGGVAPYSLEFDTDGQYKLTVSQGNVLRAYQGVIRFGNTVADQLKAPAEVAVFTIDGSPGQVISLKLQDNNQPADSQLRDADGNLVQPTGKVNANSATYTIYTLPGKAPYTLTFTPAGRYSLTLTDGTLLNSEQGIIPFGTTVTNTLPAPAQVAIYTLNTEPGQVISAKIDKGAQQNAVLNAELVDSDNNPILPQTRIVDGKGSVIYVYTLLGSGPYRFSFAPTGQYSITFNRGDASVARFPQFPTATPTSTPAPSN